MLKVTLQEAQEGVFYSKLYDSDKPTLVEVLGPYDVYGNARFVRETTLTEKPIVAEHWMDGRSIRQLEGPVSGEVIRGKTSYLSAAASGRTGVTSGADPEIFVEDSQGNIIPAWMFLPPEREAYRQARNSALYWDGFQAEFKLPPGKCLQFLVDAIAAQLGLLLAAAQRHHPGARLSSKNVWKIPTKVLQDAEPEHVELGCKPSLNVWGLEGLPVGDPRSLPWRFAGGHYHLGVGGLTPRQVDRMIRAADVVAGIPSLLMFQRMDDPIRRRFYGLPGEHRTPPHGVEYRTLSNAWLMHPAITHFTLSLLRMGLKIGLDDLLFHFQYPEAQVARIIMDHDLDAAREFVEANKAVYRSLFEHAVPKALTEAAISPSTERVQQVVEASLAQLTKPIQEFVDTTDVAANWLLGTEKWTMQSKTKGCQWSTLILK